MNKKNEAFHPYRFRCFCYDVFKDATDRFGGKNFIGEGGFDHVCKGWISYRTMNAAKQKSGPAIAVKRLWDEQPQGQDEWLNELRFLSKLIHPNIVKLIGYCGNNEHRIVVYESMAKGSAYDFKPKEPDFTSCFAGITEKCRECFGAKISDFGLTKFGPQGNQPHVSSKLLGTTGYFAPEYIATDHLTLKTDVYNFGVVLLEIFTGSMATRKHSSGAAGTLVQWAEPYLKDKVKLHHVMDSKLNRNFLIQEAQKFTEIIVKCLHLVPKSRPTMAEVVAGLEEVQSVSNHNQPNYGISRHPRRGPLIGRTCSERGKKSGWK
ncbi:probable serine/threonine-protein kinase PBL3 [Rhodamnia argentea]|uniref:Probable serine/threonine-protein kinase PBL3 n=1 Tax=Rhodamnia argentea TaxID=178133 RepID=A0ABM3HEE6_9MYRT|nr:probable serine/threonine-protein kinase PBL3 [Rhodamnia argentea]